MVQGTPLWPTWWILPNNKLAFDQWQKHYDEVERPRINRENRWAEVWRSHDWSSIESTAVSLGGNYFIEFVEKYSDASGDQLRRAALLVAEPAKKAAFESRAKLADEKAAAAAAREKAIAEEKQRQQVQKVNTNSSSPQWGNWNSYKSYSEQSAQNATKLQAMNDYLYGRNNNPLLNPFR